MSTITLPIVNHPAAHLLVDGKIPVLRLSLCGTKGLQTGEEQLAAKNQQRRVLSKLEQAIDPIWQAILKSMIRDRKK